MDWLARLPAGFQLTLDLLPPLRSGLLNVRDALVDLTSQEWVITTRYVTIGESSGGGGGGGGKGLPSLPTIPFKPLQTGGEGIVKGPASFFVEPGITEAYQFTPLTGPYAGRGGMGGGSGGNIVNISINIEGNVDSEVYEKMMRSMKLNMARELDLISRHGM